MSEHDDELAWNSYVEAAMVLCPRCHSPVGKPCTIRACRNGYRNCDYAVCSYRRELPKPHLERAVAATTDGER